MTKFNPPQQQESAPTPHDFVIGRRSLLLGAGAMAVLAACGSDETTSVPDDTTASPDVEPASSTPTETSGGGGTELDTSNPVNIGYVAALTGPVAAYGTQTLNALQLAAKHVNATGGIMGREVVIKAVDNESTPDTVPSLMQRLIDDDCSLLFGASASPPTIVAAQTADQLRVPLIVPMEAADAIIGEGRQYVFKVAPSVLHQNGWAAQGVRAVMEGAEKAGETISTALIIAASAGAFPDAIAAWERTFADEYPDVELLNVVTYDEAATSDFAPIVSQAQAENPDLLIFGGNPKGSFAFYPALEQSGWKPKARLGMLGGNTNTAFIETVGESAAEGDIAGNYWTPSLAGKGGGAYSPQQFFDDYKAEYGESPDGVGAYYYACMGLAVDAIEKAGTAEDSEAIASALRETDVAGTSGDSRGLFIVAHGAKFDASGLNERAKGLVTQIQGGVFIPVYPESVATADIKFES
jgi:branched-chain amino acid transport system substrate-binding protein